MRILLFLFILTSCSFFSKKEKKKIELEGIYRKFDMKTFPFHKPLERKREPYRWEKRDFLPITKDFFLCKGNSLNPTRVENVKGKIVSYEDCEGGFKHGLCKVNDEEVISSILLKLLNFIQRKSHNG